MVEWWQLWMPMQHMRYKQGLIEVARLEQMYKAGKNPRRLKTPLAQYFTLIYIWQKLPPTRTLASFAQSAQYLTITNLNRIAWNLVL